MQSLHRVRSRLVGMRTMLMNQLRAILLERGLVFPQGRRKFETAVGILVTDPEAQIGARIRSLVVEIREEWAADSDGSRPPIPTRSRPAFRFDVGHHSEMKPATR